MNLFKSLLVASFFLLCFSLIQAQAPEGINHQAVVRDDNGEIIANSPVSVRFTIMENDPSGPVVYQETHTTNTNDFGLMSTIIGEGAAVTGTFANINWGGASHYLEVAVDVGTGLTILGTSQLVSVPYALYAKEAGNGGGTNYQAGTGIDISGNTITNTGDTDASDDITNTSTAGGDLAGTYPNPMVSGLQGRSLSALAPSSGQVLKWNGSAWEPANDIGGGSGDDWGTQVVQTDATLSGEGTSTNVLGLAQQGATNGEVLMWNGSQWEPAMASGGSGLWSQNGNDLYYSTGNVGVGAMSPLTGFHVGDSLNVLFGLTLTGHAHPRLMWIADKGAFRAGRSVGQNWNLDSLGLYSVAMGDDTKASNQYTTALGRSTTANGINATAFGSFTLASGDNSLATGYQSSATGSFSSAFGRNTLASGGHSMASGRNAVSSGDYSIALGYGAAATDNNTIAIGNNTEATGRNATAIGFSTYATGNYSTALGRDTRASGVNSMASGNDTKASGASSTAMGELTEASGSFSTAMGHVSVASANYSFASGFGAVASGNGSISFGNVTTASGQSAIALGDNTVASGNHSVVLGFYTTASGDNTFATGASNIASGKYSFVGGYKNSAVGGSSIAFGSNSIASSSGSVAIGFHVTSPTKNEIVFGRYNTPYTPNDTIYWNSGDRLFVLGNGNGTIASNALTVYKDGRLVLGNSSPTELLRIGSTTGDGLQLGSIETFKDNGTNRIETNSDIVHTTDGNGTLGWSGNRWASVWAVNGTINTSDRNDKTNIQSSPYGLNAVLQMKPVSFQWSDQPEAGAKIGFLAQDLLEIVPEVVVTKEYVVTDEETQTGEWQNTQHYGVYYSDLIPVLAKGIQEQQDIIEDQQEQIDKLRQKNEEFERLEEKYEVLEQRIAELEDR